MINDCSLTIFFSFFISKMASHDDSISVTIAPEKKPISDQKRISLDKARGLAIIKRRETQRRSLEEKLRELKTLQSSDMTTEMIYRVAAKMVDIEQKLREKQNDLTRSVDANLGVLIEQNDKIKEMLERILRYYAPRPASSPMSANTVRK
jgi:vacuolar-type H+-ATPase subunit I/STV1